MQRRLLISGDRANFTTLIFDEEFESLKVAADYSAPHNASWVEPAPSRDDVDSLIGLSEGDDEGLVYTFEINHRLKTCELTSQKATLGAPGHFMILRDQSALAVATYFGGSIALYPIDKGANNIRFTDDTRAEVFPDFPYKSVQHGPNIGRQRQCHPHQVVEDRRGLLYVPDLGSDRVWVMHRNGMKLGVKGWLQCPSGTGPRHAVISPDEKMIHVVGELSHKVIGFDLSAHPTGVVSPIHGFDPNVIPSNVHLAHQYMMNAAEICVHPMVPRVLYVSNRWERHIKEREPHLTDVPDSLPSGDSIAIILLSGDGRKVEGIKHVLTDLDVIRGMRISDDGKYVVAVGQVGGGVEVYSIFGDRADVWTRVARLNEGLESGIKHAVWL